MEKLKRLVVETVHMPNRTKELDNARTAKVMLRVFWKSATPSDAALHFTFARRERKQVIGR